MSINSIFPAIPSGTRLKGGNLSFRLSDAQDGIDSPAFGGLWGSSRGGGWILADLTDQVDRAVSMGCNYVRVMGDVQERVGGFLLQSDYASRITSFLDYCRAAHLFVHWTFTACQQCRDFRVSLPARPIIPTADIVALFALDCAILSTYSDIVFAGDPLQEIAQVVRGFAAGSCSQDAISSSDMYALIEATYSSIKTDFPSLPVACSGMQGDSGNTEVTFTDLTILNATAGSWDFIDFHVYGYPPSQGLLDSLASAFPGTGLLIGEVGAPLDDSSGTTPVQYSSALNNSKCFGGAVWALRDYAVSDPPNQWGTHDDSTGIRLKGILHRDYISGFDSAENYLSFAPSYNRTFTGAPNTLAPFTDGGWVDESSAWSIVSGFLTALISGVIFLPTIYSSANGQRVSVVMDTNPDTDTQLSLAVGVSADFTSSYSAIVNLTSGSFSIFCNDPSIGGGFTTLKTAVLFTPDNAVQYTFQLDRVISGNISTLQLSVFSGSLIVARVAYDDDRSATAVKSNRGFFVNNNQFSNPSALLRIVSLIVEERQSQPVPGVSSLSLGGGGSYIALSPSTYLSGGPTGFSVLKNGSAAAISSVVPIGSAFRIFLSSPATSGDVITLSYDSASGTLRNLDHVLGSFSNAPMSSSSSRIRGGMFNRLGLGLLFPSAVNAAVALFYYLRPDGTSKYNRPDETSFYFIP